MAVISTLILNTKIMTEGISKGIAKAKGLVGKFSAGITAVKAGYDAVKTGLAAVGLDQAYDQIRNITQAAIENADRINDLSANVSMSASEFSSLSYAAQQSGVDMETLAGGLGKLKVNLADAARTGKGSTKAALDELGLSAQELTKMTDSQAMGAIGDALNKIEDPATRLALQMDLAGKAGLKMGALFSEGSDGISAMQARSDELGITLSDIGNSRIAVMNDSLDTLYAALNGVGQQIASSIAPYITTFSEALLNSGVFGEQMGQMIQWAVDTAGTALMWLVDATQVVYEYWSQASVNIQSFFSPVIDFINGVIETIDSLIGKTARLTMQFGVAGLIGGLLDTGIEDARDKGTAWSKQLEKIKKQAEEAAQAHQGLRGATSQVAESLVESVDKGQEFVENLREQIETFGMGRNEAALYKLAQEGVSEAMIKQAKTLITHLDALEAQKKATEDNAKRLTDEKKARDEAVKAEKDKWDQIAEQVKESVKSPLEAFEEEQQKLNELRKRGLIDEMEFTKASLNAREKALSGMGQDFDDRLASADLAGSEAARSSLLSHNRQGALSGSKQEREIALMEKLVEIAQRQLRKQEERETVEYL